MASFVPCPSGIVLCLVSLLLSCSSGLPLYGGTRSHLYPASSNASFSPAADLRSDAGRGPQRFLAVPLPGSKSHYIQFAVVIKELVQRGHHVKVRTWLKSVGWSSGCQGLHGPCKEEGGARPSFRLAEHLAMQVAWRS